MERMSLFHHFDVLRNIQYWIFQLFGNFQAKNISVSSSNGAAAEVAGSDWKNRYDSLTGGRYGNRESKATAEGERGRKDDDRHKSHRDSNRDRENDRSRESGRIKDDDSMILFGLALFLSKFQIIAKFTGKCGSRVALLSLFQIYSIGLYVSKPFCRICYCIVKYIDLQCRLIVFWLGDINFAHIVFLEITHLNLW